MLGLGSGLFSPGLRVAQPHLSTFLLSGAAASPQHTANLCLWIYLFASSWVRGEEDGARRWGDIVQLAQAPGSRPLLRAHKGHAHRSPATLRRVRWLRRGRGGRRKGRMRARPPPSFSLCPPSAKACNSVGLNRSTETRGEPPPFLPFFLRHTTAPLLRRRLVIPPEKGGALIHIWEQLAHSLLTLDPTLASRGRENGGRRPSGCYSTLSPFGRHGLGREW